MTLLNYPSSIPSRPVLTQQGILVLTYGRRLIGIRTPIPGLANSSNPRSHDGGNQNRGWAEPYEESP